MDTEKLLACLNDHNVKYVVIGATAFPVHGYVRATLDTDIFIEPVPENAKKVMKALKEFGYDLTDVSVKDLLTKKILIRQYYLEIDIHPHVSGVNFEEVWNSKVQSSIGSVKSNFASLSALIKMKKAAKRPKDLEDLKYLEQLQKRKK
jgi:predicted nucleotidyltransferase